MARRAADSAVPAAVRISAVALAPGLGEARRREAEQGQEQQRAKGHRRKDTDQGWRGVVRGGMIGP